MIILLQGKDRYRQKEVLRKIIKNHKVSLFEFNSKSDNINHLINKTRQRSIFKEEKLFIVSNLLENIGAGKEVLSFLENCSGSSEMTLVLVEEKAIPKKKSLMDLIDKIYDINPIKGKELENWIKSEFCSRGGEIDDLALKELIMLTGNDLWALSNEIDKIVSYKKGLRASVADIVLLVKPKIETDIFRAIDALANKDKRRALNMVYAHLEKGVPVSYILSMIGFQFRNLNLVKNDNGSAIELELHPYVFNKTTNQSRRFSKDELKDIYSRIVSSDAGIKTGKIEAGTALDLFIFNL